MKRGIISNSMASETVSSAFGLGVFALTQARAFLLTRGFEREKLGTVQFKPHAAERDASQ